MKEERKIIGRPSFKNCPGGGGGGVFMRSRGAKPYVCVHTHVSTVYLPCRGSRSMLPPGIFSLHSEITSGAFSGASPPPPPPPPNTPAN